MVNFQPNAPTDKFTLTFEDRGATWFIDAGVLAVRNDGEPEPPPPAPIRGIPMIGEVRLPMLNLHKPWYEATRRFGPYNGHPRYCEDWNLESGGDTDLGEPLVAPFAGIVLNAYDAGGGWGNIVRILGRLPDGPLVTWMGAHLAEIYVRVGQIVDAGDDVGTIGTGNGRYAAHLHEQICEGAVPGPEVFGTDRRYQFKRPSRWYVDHGVDPDLVERVTQFDGA
jgi:hypothetical protein